jgi:hypothetical protein
VYNDSFKIYTEEYNMYRNKYGLIRLPSDTRFSLRRYGMLLKQVPVPPLTPPYRPSLAALLMHSRAASTLL